MEMTLFERYEDYLTDNNWKDKVGGSDWDTYTYIGKDGAYEYFLTVVDRADKVLIVKKMHNSEIFYKIETSDPPEIVIGELLKWEVDKGAEI